MYCLIHYPLLVQVPPTTPHLVTGGFIDLCPLPDLNEILKQQCQWATRPVRAGSDSAPGHWHPWPTTNSEQWKSDGGRRAAAGWGAERRLSPMVHGRHHILGQCQCRCLGYSSPANSPSSACCTPPPTNWPLNSPEWTVTSERKQQPALEGTPPPWQPLSCANRSLNKSGSDGENLRGERRTTTQTGSLNRQKQRLGTAASKKQTRA